MQLERSRGDGGDVSAVQLSQAKNRDKSVAGRGNRLGEILRTEHSRLEKSSGGGHGWNVA